MRNKTSKSSCNQSFFLRFASKEYLFKIVFYTLDGYSLSLSYDFEVLFESIQNVDGFQKWKCVRGTFVWRNTYSCLLSECAL